MTISAALLCTRYRATFPSARFYAKQKNMRKAISAKQKSRGRPATGQTPMMGFRADPLIRAEIVRWAENQPNKPTLSEAIRRLVELGLTVGAKQKQTSAATANRAKELASNAIESLTSGAANNDAKTNRKSRLIKGPEEFREVRVDRPKAKGK
jgi:hypothetical protein